MSLHNVNFVFQYYQLVVNQTLVAWSFSSQILLLKIDSLELFNELINKLKVFKVKQKRQHYQHFL